MSHENNLRASRAKPGQSQFIVRLRQDFGRGQVRLHGEVAPRCLTALLTSPTNEFAPIVSEYRHLLVTFISRSRSNYLPAGRTDDEGNVQFPPSASRAVLML